MQSPQSSFRPKHGQGGQFLQFSRHMNIGVFYLVGILAAVPTMMRPLLPTALAAVLALFAIRAHVLTASATESVESGKMELFASLG